MQGSKKHRISNPYQHHCLQKGKEFASHRQNCDKSVDKLDDGEDDLGLRSVSIEELALWDVLIHKGSKMYHKNSKYREKTLQDQNIIYNSDVI